MKKNKSLINNLGTKFLFPYILGFVFYLQLYGELGPGGGFQAGAVLASALIAYDISLKKNSSTKSNLFFLRVGAFGVLIYLLTGLYSMFLGENFLNYYVISKEHGQSTGIMIVEFGVGITVFSIMYFLYKELKNAE